MVVLPLWWCYPYGGVTPMVVLPLWWCYPYGGVPGSGPRQTRARTAAEYWFFPVLPWGFISLICIILNYLHITLDKYM